MPKILQELSRRNVNRVAVAYLVLSWVLLQVGDVLFEALRLDDSVLTMLVAILALGFIPVVVFAWIYELTPEGVKRESDVDRSTSITPNTGHRLNIAIVILLAVAIGLFAWDRFGSGSGANEPDDRAPSRDLATEAGSPSIAVLPFADMSAQADQAYFGDGIAEELLNVLAKVDGLKVAARTSSFKFRGDEHDIVEIGRALNVATVLEGSVRKSGNQVRITAQLIDVQGGFHLWSESYDRQLDNIFAVQDEIAASIVDALKLELSLQPVAREEAAADTGEAYDLYLRGRELAREPSKERLLRAVEFYEEALALSPNLAPVHGAIASAWIWLEDYGGVSSQDAFDRAEPAALRALELDPTRVDALTAMGFLEDRKYDNAVAAREYFERALAINPAFTEASTLYADVLADFGEMTEALQLRRDAVKIDPLSSFLKSRLVSLLVSLREIDEADRLIGEIFALNPDDTYGYEELANRHFALGQFADAVKAYKVLHDGRPGDPFAAANLAIAYELMLDREAAQAWADEARLRGAANRWELEARRSLAQWRGDWDGMFRAGQLYLSKSGATWQGVASLGKSDWEAARASFLRSHSRMKYRQGDEPNGNVLESLAGLALAEKRLGLESWTKHAEAAQSFAEKKIKDAMVFGRWPNVNLHYLLAQLAALHGDTEQVVNNMQLVLDYDMLRHTFILHDPFFAGLRDEPRLLRIAAEMRDRALSEYAKLKETTGIVLPDN
jgi:TolB-like protein/Tfp pilus assembly protein PilF